MELVLACAAAYLLGGVPFGLVMVRVLRGVDIRSIGSGNVGATNASRAFPGRSRLLVFLLIYVLDFAKGFVPAVVFVDWCGDEPLHRVLIGAAAIVGHCFSPFLGFRGGKGVATATGVFAALDWQALLVGLAVFFLVLAVTRRVFWGSIALGFGLALAVVFRDQASAFDERLPVTVFAAVIALFIVYTHRSNLAAALAARTVA